MRSDANSLSASRPVGEGGRGEGAQAGERAGRGSVVCEVSVVANHACDPGRVATITVGTDCCTCYQVTVLCGVTQQTCVMVSSVRNQMPHSLAHCRTRQLHCSCCVLKMCTVLLRAPSACDHVRLCVSPMGGRYQLVSSTLTSCNLQQGHRTWQHLCPTKHPTCQCSTLETIPQQHDQIFVCNGRFTCVSNDSSRSLPFLEPLRLHDCWHSWVVLASHG
jgi:hypothetical protein